MAENNLQAKLLEQLNAIAMPLKLAATDDVAFHALFKRLGWNFDNIKNFPVTDLLTLLSQISVVVDDIISLVNNPPESIDDFIDCLDVLQDLFDLIEDFDTVIQSSTSIPASLKTEFQQTGKDLIDFLLCNYLRLNYNKLYYFLSFVGLIDPHELYGMTEYKSGSSTEGWARDSFPRSTINFNKLSSLLTDPKQYFIDNFYPASGVITTDAEAKEFSDKFFPRLVLLLNALGFYAVYGTDPADASYFAPDVFAEMSRTLSFRALLDQGFDFGASVNVSKTGNNIYGAILNLFGGYNFAKKIGDWYLSSSISASVDAFSVDEQGVSFPTSFAGSSLGANLSIYRVFEEETLQQLGSTNGTRFHIRDILLQLFLSLQQNNNYYGGTLYLDGIEFFIGGGDGDGFIKKIIPNGIGGKFDLSIGWNNKNGLQFGGSGGLEIHLPAHISLGPVDFNGLTLGIGLDNGTIPITAGATVVAKLGPIVATVENMGLKCTLSFPPSGGNLGFANMAFGFKLPNGIGLKIKASVVEGGGYLYIDKDKGRYYGAVELKIANKLSLSAIGIITTKNPDGSDGFSLLVLICVTFAPSIPIGFGFSLSGVGGMIGVNRSMATEPLRQGVKTGAINNILFPQNVVENIQTIITDLEQIFPIQKDRYVFGLFFLLGWGVPTPLIKIKLGVIIEVPSPVKLAIIGNLSLKLPSEDKPILQLNVAFAGIIDFDKKYLTFDATIYDSKILTFSLFGDMAVRVFWGEHREILISVGGFHPAYNPPAYLLLPAKMDRLTISIFNESNLKLQLATYFAVTSNTVQFGARLDFLFKVSKFQVVGIFGFDVLFQFNPFKFRTDVYAMLAVKCGSRELMSLSLDFMLEGPGPWHAKGNASFKVLFIKCKVSFDKTWGPQPATSLPDVAVVPLITADLQKKENWLATLPDQKKLLVSMKELPATDIVLHPLGTLSITQKIAPLGVKLERFGNQKPSDGGIYDISSVKLQTVTQNTESVTDSFAPAQFRNMDDNQKLKAASFENLRAGVQLKSLSGSELYMDRYVTKEVAYERILIDNIHYDKQRYKVRRGILNAFTRGGLISANTISREVRADLNSPIVKASMKQESYQIISKDSLKELSTITGSGIADTKSGSQADVLTLMEKLVQQKPALAGKIQAVPVY